MERKLKKLKKEFAEIPPEIVERSYKAFQKAKNFSDLQKIMLLFLDNKVILPQYPILFQQPYYDTIDPKYTEDLLTMNSKGLITLNSQAGEKKGKQLKWQRMFVQGIAKKNVAEKLHKALNKLDGIVVSVYAVVQTGNAITIVTNYDKGAPRSIISNGIIDDTLVSIKDWNPDLAKKLKNDRYYCVQAVDTVWGRNVLFKEIRDVLTK